MRSHLGRQSGLLFLAGLALAGSYFSATITHAMTRSVVELTCPYDGVKFSFSAQNSGSTFDKQLDWMPVGAIESPWPIASCPTNGFVFIKQKYEDEELERLRPLILSPEYQNIKSETPYYRAAWIMERSGASHVNVSGLLLQATWEAGRAELVERARASPSGSTSRDTGDLMRSLMMEGTTSERYRRYATELLARLAVDLADPTRNADGRISDRFLIGEMLRRLGRFDEAETHFAALANDLAPDSRSAALAALQRRLIAGKDIGVHMMSEASGKSR